jgi:hypothetical protein
MTAKPRICLLDDWRRVLRRAWSIRFSLLAAAFTAAEVVVPLFGTCCHAAYFECWLCQPHRRDRCAHRGAAEMHHDPATITSDAQSVAD